MLLSSELEEKVSEVLHTSIKQNPKKKKKNFRYEFCKFGIYMVGLLVI